jgi:hypothetical protein
VGHFKAILGDMGSALIHCWARGQVSPTLPKLSMTGPTGRVNKCEHECRKNVAELSCPYITAERNFQHFSTYCGGTPLFLCVFLIFHMFKICFRILRPNTCFYMFSTWVHILRRNTFFHTCFTFSHNFCIIAAEHLFSHCFTCSTRLQFLIMLADSQPP